MGKLGPKRDNDLSRPQRERLNWVLQMNYVSFLSQVIVGQAQLQPHKLVHKKPCPFLYLGCGNGQGKPDWWLAKVSGIY